MKGITIMMIKPKGRKTIFFKRSHLNFSNIDGLHQKGQRFVYEYFFNLVYIFCNNFPIDNSR